MNPIINKVKDQIILSLINKTREVYYFLVINLFLEENLLRYKILI